MGREFDVLIVGGGFCGTVLAANLARSGRAPRVAILDPNDAGDFGPAYRTNCASHLLNAPAVAMSAFPDDPNHFLNWANKRGAELEAGSVAPRRLYRHYLNSIWELGGFEHLRDLAAGLEKTSGGWRVALASGQVVTSREVVLAFGVARPQAFEFEKEIAGHPAYTGDLWESGDLRLPADVQRAAIVGSGLTAIDAILAVEDKGYSPHYSVVSRRGLLPMVHGPKPPVPPIPPGISPSIRTLLRQFRAAVRTGADFRALIDALRPNIANYWQALDIEQRARFLRHVRPFWETHRHRMAPQIWASVEALRSEGRFEVRADRIVGVLSVGNRLKVSYASGKIEVVDVLFNCAGPSPIASWDSPLISQLLQAGLIELEPLGLGVECDRNGQVSEGLHVLGMLRKGMLWESTAVRELSVQAAHLAEILSESLDVRSESA